MGARWGEATNTLSVCIGPVHFQGWDPAQGRRNLAPLPAELMVWWEKTHKWLIIIV